MKLAMIGSYGHSGTIAGGADAADDVELIAAAPWGPDDPLDYARRRDVKVFEDWRAMLAATEPDVVGVFCPLYRNAEVAAAAAEAGAHVISEKPLATTHADLDRLRKALATAKVRIAALLTMRTEGPFRTVRRLVSEGAIGRPVLAFGQKSYPFANRDDYYRQRETYGGSIPWQAIHALDFVAWCTGQEYTSAAAMHANAAHPTHPGMEDCGGILLGLDGGGQAVISFDYLRPWGEQDRPWGDDRLRIAGTEGVVEVADAGRTVRLETPDASEEVAADVSVDFLASFVAALKGTGECVIGHEESLRLTEVALRCRDAADRGEIMQLQHPHG